MDAGHEARRPDYRASGGAARHRGTPHDLFNLLTNFLLPNRANSDYCGLKKQITAIKDQIAATRQSRDRKNGRDNTNIVSSSAETTLNALNTNGIRRRPTLGNQSDSQAKNILVLSPRDPTVSGTTKIKLPEEASSALPVRSQIEGYGSFGTSPPLLDQSVKPYPNSVYGQSEGLNSLPEMTLPPPIKSISDLRINELPVNGGQANVSGPDQVSTPPNPLVDANTQ
jgi:hypothetical protein